MDNPLIICAVGVAFVIAMVAVAINPQISKEQQEFIATLNDVQMEVYNNIIKSRRDIFIQATIAGILAGFAAIYYFKTSSIFSNGCIFLAIGFIVQYFWYIFAPKKDWMVRYLSTQQQLEEWTDVYSTFQKTYHSGIVIGLVGYFLIGYGFNM